MKNIMETMDDLQLKVLKSNRCQWMHLNISLFRVVGVVTKELFEKGEIDKKRMV
jgi:hypothetical protein